MSTLTKRVEQLERRIAGATIPLFLFDTGDLSDAYVMQRINEHAQLHKVRPEQIEIVSFQWQGYEGVDFEAIRRRSLSD